jgi:uncharacterized protein (TIGR00369 family)
VTFHDTLGVDIRLDGDAAVVTMVADERHLNGHGSVHGGLLATLADIAMGAVLNAHTPDDAGPVTVSLVTTYLEPAPPGSIVATGRITRQGKRITIAGAEITSADGATVATAVGTFTTV